MCGDHPRRALGGLYHCAKFGWNRCSSFDNMHVFRFREFGFLKTPTHAPKLGVFRGKITSRGGAILTPNKLVLTFGGLHVCVQFGENRRRNATARVFTDGQTHTHTHGQTQNDFIICPMLYAIAMEQIIIFDIYVH